MQTRIVIIVERRAFRSQEVVIYSERRIPLCPCLRRADECANKRAILKAAYWIVQDEERMQGTMALPGMCSATTGPPQDTLLTIASSSNPYSYPNPSSGDYVSNNGVLAKMEVIGLATRALNTKYGLLGAVR
jgi:hypothetical protein